jgi:hypothetical protein
MGIFGSIMDKIFSRAEASPQAGGTSSPVAPASEQQAAPATASTVAQSAPATGAGAGSQSVDVEAVLSGMASKAGQQLDWRRSIVDLMKLLNLDSSLSARKELAQELQYTGDVNDSAAMNVWLHKQVMRKLAENGGKVPDSLKS